MNRCTSCNRRIPRHHRTCVTCARETHNRETMRSEPGLAGYESFTTSTTEIPWLEPSRPDTGPSSSDSGGSGE